MRLDKRGLSQVVTTVLLIAISLVALIIVSIVVFNLIQKNSEQSSLNQFGINLDIVEAVPQNSLYQVDVKVKRLVGSGDLTGIRFIFEDGLNSQTFDREKLVELESKTFYFNFSNNSLVVNYLEKVSVRPIFKNSAGEEVIGEILDTYDILTQEVLDGDIPVTASECYGEFADKMCRQKLGSNYYCKESDKTCHIRSHSGGGSGSGPGPTGAVCGDGICNSENGETCLSCSTDCGVCPNIGIGWSSIGTSGKPLYAKASDVLNSDWAVAGECTRMGFFVNGVWKIFIKDVPLNNLNLAEGTGYLIYCQKGYSSEIPFYSEFSSTEKNSFKYSLSYGTNFVSPTCTNLIKYASDFLDWVEFNSGADNGANCNSLSKYVDGEFIEYNKNIPDANFNLEMGKGYMLRCDNAVEFTLPCDSTLTCGDGICNGEEICSTCSSDCGVCQNIGPSHLGISGKPLYATAEDVLNSDWAVAGECYTFSKFNGPSQTWTQYVSKPFPNGNFNLDSGVGYRLSCNKGYPQGINIYSDMSLEEQTNFKYSLFVPPSSLSSKYNLFSPICVTDPILTASTFLDYVSDANAVNCDRLDRLVNGNWVEYKKGFSGQELDFNLDIGEVYRISCDSNVEFNLPCKSIGQSI